MARMFLKSLLCTVLSALLVGLPVRTANAQGCPYTTADLVNMTSGLLGYSSIDSAGNIYDAVLSQDAYDYLTSNGFIDASGAIVLSTTTWEIPGVGEVVVAITVVVIAYTAAKALESWVMARGKSDPAVVRALVSPVQGAINSNGSCNGSDRPTQYKWMAVNLVNNAGVVHWHWINWNQNPVTCQWFMSRQEGPADPGPAYVLIPGLY